jgi:hypothetical protein
MIKAFLQALKIQKTESLKRKLTTETLDYDTLKEIATVTDRYIEVILPGATIKIYNREHKPDNREDRLYY